MHGEFRHSSIDRKTAKMIPALVVLLLTQYMVASPSSAQELQCHKEGQCSGLFIGGDIMDSYNLCLDHCRTNSTNCNWVTYFEDTRECVQFLDCPAIDLTCSNCFSGQKQCPPRQPACNVPGICIGHFVAANQTQTVDKCLKFCQSMEECNWYSYVSGDSNCFLTKDCVTLDESCTGCLAGERDCQPDAVPKQKLFVVGAYGPGGEGQVEVVGLSGQSCTGLADFPAGEWGSVGVFLDNRTMVCSGGRRNNNNPAEDCLTYVASANAWEPAGSMLIGRDSATAVQLSPTKWWVTGGYNLGGLASTEMFTASEGFSDYVDLPEAAYYHNLVKINSSHAILLGGSSASVKSWIHNLETETWSDLPDLLVATSRAQAGLVTHPDGRAEVAVAAGAETAATQFFSLDTMMWRLGPDFPAGRLYHGNSVPYGDTFLIVGGFVRGPQSSIYMFDVESQGWVELPQTLAIARHIFSAFLVPDDFVTC